MHRGYVKLWRKSIDSGFLGNAEAWQLLCWCLIKASHRQHKILVGKQIVELQPGQLIFGRKTAAHELNSTERKIRTSLKLLENAEFLTSKTTNKFTVISIVNWHSYQEERPVNDQQNDQQSSQQTTNKRPTNDHKQECKTQEEKEKQASKARAHARGASFPDYDELVAEYTTNQDLKQALGEFIVMRVASKKPFTNAALQHTFRELNKLAGADLAAKIAIVQQSVQRGWPGVFPLKSSGPEPPPNVPQKTAAQKVLDALEREYVMFDKGGFCSEAELAERAKQIEAQRQIVAQEMEKVSGGVT